MRKGLFFLLFFCFFATLSKGQQYDIGVSSGLFTPLDFWYYQEGKPGLISGVSFSYHTKKRLVLSTNISKGGFQYNPALSELRVNGQKVGPENSKVDVYFFYLGIGRIFTLNETSELVVNSGFGFFLENRLAFNEEDLALRGQIQYYRDATFPIQVQYRKEITPSLWLGMRTGFFLTPFYTFGGFHLTPTLSFRL